ncbi:MAG: Gfo/Idh/MocA family oxidoreductase [Phycisphaerales bacterium]|nr:Gfo/Idh/MocA family oxidoreductase [Phycisphaerales bacterium]
MSIRLGVIGAGGIGRQHAESAAAAGSTVAMVCDVDLERARGLAADFDNARATADVDEMLSNDGLDGVVVAAPNAVHNELAIAALEAGKDVLLEKPMALDAAECDQIIKTLDASDQLLQLGFVSRYSPRTRQVAEFIASGRLGRIYYARAQWYRRRGIPGLGGWFTAKKMAGGGVLIDLGVHLIDLVLHLTGRPAPERVSGVCTSTFGSPIDQYTYTDMWAGPPRPGGVFDVEDGAHALIRCAGGLTMELATTWAANIDEQLFPTGILLLGDRGGCFFETWGSTLTLSTEMDGALVDVKPQLPPGDPWAIAWEAEHAAFGVSVASRTPPAASAADGRQVQSVLDAIYRSSAAGREVEVE